MTMCSERTIFLLLAVVLPLFLFSLSQSDEDDLVWSTFFGGSDHDWVKGIALDGSGSVYVVGNTISVDFPATADAFDTTFHGGHFDGDVFVLKLNPMGSALVYATYLGGVKEDAGNAIAVDRYGNAYVVGETRSAEFPSTPEAFSETLNGIYSDGFVSKFNPIGSELIYSTFLGGTEIDRANDIVIDDDGNAYVTGATYSVDFPITSGVLDTFHGGHYIDAFVVKLDSIGSSLQFATFLGGSGSDEGNCILVDDSGAIYIAGSTWSEDFPVTHDAFDTTLNARYGGAWDVFAARMNRDATILEYATYVGGVSKEYGKSMAVDAGGNMYIIGDTESNDFPVTSNALDDSYNGGDWDAFVVKIDSAGTHLDYSTFLGGSQWDIAKAIAVDETGRAYICGSTGSQDFPTTSGAFDSIVTKGDAFVAILNNTGSALDYATVLGGDRYERGRDMIWDGSNTVYVAGETRSRDFPTTEGVFDSSYNDSLDIFVARLSPGGTPVTVVLASFEASTAEGLLTLNWVTTSEVDCQRWEVYRSQAETGDYAKVWDVAGHGTTEESHVYQWMDQSVIPGKTYFYKLLHVDHYGRSWWSHIISAVAVPPLPQSYALQQNYPNPFNAGTNIRYHIREDGHVSIVIFNVLGQEVRTILDAEQKAGIYVISWNGRDFWGEELASGVYFCRLQAGEFGKTIKMVLLK
jgi:hypothetical protein